MIWQIVKKQGLVLLRNPQQLLLLIGLPIILISILGAALGNLMEGTTPDIQIKVGMIENGDEEAQIERFIQDLENKSLPKEAVEQIESYKQQMAPIRMLKETIFGSNELVEIVELHQVEISRKDVIIGDDSYDALIEVPENFTYDALEFMFLNEQSQPTLEVFQNEGSAIGFSVVNDILEKFQEQLTLGTFIKKKGMDQRVLQVAEGEVTSETVSLNQRKPVIAKDYYAVGMAVMNVLFIASTIGAMAFLEKKMHVFDRMILAKMSRWTYFIGIFLSTSIFAFLQLLIIYGFSWVVYGVQWPDLLSFFTVTFAYAMAVGGIGVLLTALSYRINSEIITNFFSSIIVTIFAFLGGSFFPIGDSSNLIQKLGDLTPNGAGMSAYLAILRGDGISTISNHLVFLVIFALVAIIIAAMSFPKRGLSI